MRSLIAPLADGPAEEVVTAEGELLGLPLFVDSPVLLYNKDLFNAAGIAEFPRTWDDFAAAAKKLTTNTPAGDIIKSGAALGTYREIAYGFDILSSFFLQHGDPVVNRATGAPVLQREAKDALERYTSFANPASEHFSWSARFGNSLDAFVEERTAIAVGKVGDIPRARSRNPHLNVGVLAFPQLKEARTPVVYGEYFFPVVSNQSKNKAAAWEFVIFLGSAEGTGAYVKESARAPARRDLLAAGAPSSDLEPVYRQALISRGWPVPDEAAVSRLFEQAVESVIVRRGTPERAIADLREKMELLLR